MLLTPSPGSPAALGYRMPAEWEPHAATWLSWPHKEASWPGKLERIPPIWVEMVRQLVAGELVNVLVNDAAPAASLTSTLTISPATSWRTISTQIGGMRSSLPGQDASLCGHDSQVAACGSHSAGIR